MGSRNESTDASICQCLAWCFLLWEGIRERDPANTTSAKRGQLKLQTTKQTETTTELNHPRYKTSFPFRSLHFFGFRSTSFRSFGGAHGGRDETPLRGFARGSEGSLEALEGRSGHADGALALKERVWGWWCFMGLFFCFCFLGIFGYFVFYLAVCFVCRRFFRGFLGLKKGFWGVKEWKRLKSARNLGKLREWNEVKEVRATCNLW